MKELKELSKWEDIPHSRKGRLSIEMSILPTLIYRFHMIPIKISISYFVDINKLIIKFIQRQKTQNGHHSIAGQ